MRKLRNGDINSMSWVGRKPMVEDEETDEVDELLREWTTVLG